MKIEDFLGEHPGLRGQLKGFLDAMIDPETARPPKAKGTDAIAVHGYLVKGHWRKRWYPVNGRPRRARVRPERLPIEE
jgi:hypothetical protein